MGTEVNASEPTRPVRPDTDVEVRSEFSGRWVPGFAVEESGDAGYRLRRKSDTVVLPEWFSADEVRVNDR